MTAAVWVAREEEALLDFLVKHAHEAGDGGNFKKAVFERALPVVRPLHKRGPPKTVKMLQNKYSSWRGTYRVVLALQNVSGWTYSDKDGCGITHDNAASWDEYVLHHPAARPFRNKGWEHLEKFLLIAPSAAPPGHHVFHASQASQPAAQSDDEMPNDYGADEDDPSLLALSQSPSHCIPPPSQSTSTPSPPLSQTSAAPLSQISSPSTPTRRQRPKTAAAALEDMAVSVARFGSDIAAALAPPANAVDPTPRRRIDALKAFKVNEKDRLSSSDFITMIDILRRDKTACDTYLIFADDEALRVSWIDVQLLTASLNN